MHEEWTQRQKSRRSKHILMPIAHVRAGKPLPKYRIRPGSTIE